MSDDDFWGSDTEGDSGGHAVEMRRECGEGRWHVLDAISHSSFWLAQASYSLVHSIVAAVVFHRLDLLTDIEVIICVPSRTRACFLSSVLSLSPHTCSPNPALAPPNIATNS